MWSPMLKQTPTSISLGIVYSNQGPNPPRSGNASNLTSVSMWTLGFLTGNFPVSLQDVPMGFILLCLHPERQKSTPTRTTKRRNAQKKGFVATRKQLGQIKIILEIQLHCKVNFLFLFLFLLASRRAGREVGNVRNIGLTESWVILSRGLQSFNFRVWVYSPSACHSKTNSQFTTEN